jgi:hypothetical protein
MKDATFNSLLIGLIVFGLIGALTIPPYFEMRTFNKFSEQKATYIDALFSELRVIGGVK